MVQSRPAPTTTERVPQFHEPQYHHTHKRGNKQTSWQYDVNTDSVRVEPEHVRVYLPRLEVFLVFAWFHKKKV